MAVRICSAPKKKRPLGSKMTQSLNQASLQQGGKVVSRKPSGSKMTQSLNQTSLQQGGKTIQKNSGKKVMLRDQAIQQSLKSLKPGRSLTVQNKNGTVTKYQKPKSKKNNNAPVTWASKLKNRYNRTKS